jgi:periplasmic protein TonB
MLRAIWLSAIILIIAAEVAVAAVADRSSAPSVGGVNASVALVSWREMVVARLQRAKRYPRGAESRREQGVVTLRFSLGRNGKVLARSIAHSSGYAELDQAALAMVLRARPFPPFPSSVTQPRINLSVPVRFSLRSRAAR